MDIPNTFTVPQFILDSVRVAPDEYPSCSEPAAATARLNELRKFITQPDIQYLLGKVVMTLAKIDLDIDEKRFAGVHDVMNQQQLIGERRGLRMFLKELADVHDDLVKVITTNK